MTSRFGPTSYGAARGDRATAHAAWTASDGVADRVDAAIELAKHGDFSTREELLELLLAGIQDDELHVDAQHLLLSTATSSLALDERLIEYAANLGGRPLATFAGSGSAFLATASVPFYLGLAESLEHYEEMRVRATDSIMTLTGIVYDEYDDDATIAEYGARAMDAVRRIDAPYAIDGQAFVPASTAKRVTATAMQACDAGTAFAADAALQRLATWSGVPNPTRANVVPTKDDVAAIVSYAVALSKLPWRPGVKYFYGHDVDGGPGLREAAA